MEIVTRFAPSPTGKLHLGHAYSAILAHDFARKQNGRFLVRIEDIDGTRSRPEHVDSILADLRWLGLTWDGPVLFQSQRLAHYEAALDTLRARGLLYPCFCTRADIAASLTAPHGPEGAVYPGTCRTLVQPDLSRPHCWRLDMQAALHPLTGIGSEPLLWEDAVAGVVPADPAAQGDVVLARKDAPASYHLAVTIDDAAQAITHILRGTDLFPATHIHRLLQQILDLPTPQYHHHALLQGPDGVRLAKRHGAPTLEAMRLSGVDGAVVASQLRQNALPVGISAAKA